MRGAGEPLVAAAPRAAPRDRGPLSRHEEIVTGAVALDDRLGAGRHGQLEHEAVGPVAQPPLAVAAPASPVLRSSPIGLQVAQRAVADEHDVAAASAVTAVRTAAGDVGLAAKGQGPVAAAAGLDADARSILHGGRAELMSDPVFLITGASSGIGAATARAAAREGYRLVLAARSVDRLSDLAGELGGPQRALARACDVTEWADQEALVAETLDCFGRLDVAFANAGSGAQRGFTAESPERWKSMVLTNVYGAALTIRATIGPLREARGHLLLTGSAAGRKAMNGSLYSATKWAVTAMGESVRQELNGTGTRVTVIEPGKVDTPFFDAPPADALEGEDIARAVMYAVSQPARVDVNELLIRPTAQDG